MRELLAKYRLAIGILAWVVGALFLLAVDLVTKQIAAAYLGSGEVVEFIPGFLSFRFVHNEGIAFGIGESNRAFMIVVTVLTVVLAVGIGVVSFTVFRKNRPVQVTLAFIEAGALGNLVDRLVLGYVRDFLDMSAFQPFGWAGWAFNFGVCNVADYFITIGAAALLFCLLFIGPSAAFPLKKSWREEAQREEGTHDAP